MFKQNNQPILLFWTSLMWKSDLKQDKKLLRDVKKILPMSMVDLIIYLFIEQLFIN